MRIAVIGTPWVPVPPPFYGGPRLCSPSCYVDVFDTHASRRALLDRANA